MPLPPWKIFLFSTPGSFIYWEIRNGVSWRVARLRGLDANLVCHTKQFSKVVALHIIMHVTSSATWAVIFGRHENKNIVQFGGAAAPLPHEWLATILKPLSLYISSLEKSSIYIMLDDLRLISPEPRKNCRRRRRVQYLAWPGRYCLLSTKKEKKNN